jgi:hypothetical protein
MAELVKLFKLCPTLHNTNELTGREVKVTLAKYPHGETRVSSSLTLISIFFASFFA